MPQKVKTTRNQPVFHQKIQEKQAWLLTYNEKMKSINNQHPSTKQFVMKFFASLILYEIGSKFFNSMAKYTGSPQSNNKFHTLLSYTLGSKVANVIIQPLYAIITNPLYDKNISLIKENKPINDDTDLLIKKITEVTFGAIEHLMGNGVSKMLTDTTITIHEGIILQSINRIGIQSLQLWIECNR